MVPTGRWSSFFFQAEDGIRDHCETGVQTCALPILMSSLVATEREVNPEEALLNQELQEIIQRGLEELPLDQRVAVILCDVQGLSYEEIATTTQTRSEERRVGKECR